MVHPGNGILFINKKKKWAAKPWKHMEEISMQILTERSQSEKTTVYFNSVFQKK